ncbi:integrin alpha-PS1 isoform X2 [Phymastichus coffea]|uniref:integrin alpha-PS1 isoform X2 n=1 Tax=Phymastichus coffea TaxID=108790 RepID=UPI00273B610D|nr:integrin alpha-PS1 isoform X2 [Phymastichus coffea]
MLTSRVSLLWLLLSFSALTRGFNLEPRIPVIKRGASGSYFGFSIAEHQEDRGDENPKYVSWMLVGAPLDQNRQPGTNHSGALWMCPMTSDEHDCEQLITDGRFTMDNDTLTKPSSNEIVDGQWLGVTVRSAGVGGKVMVCAHRYIVKNKDSQWGQGQCYIFSQDLKFQEMKKPCSGKPTARAHEQYGYCQAGTSGALEPSGDYALIGTPGPHTWRGTLYVTSVSDAFFSKDTVVYSSPMQDESPVSKYSYLGMSVTVGDFFKSGMAYGAGAPRSNGTGQVILFARHLQRPEMEVKLVLNGEQFASSFGYELASADVNGDRQADLIVAAPFYYGRQEGGAVYVYTKLCENPRDAAHCNRPTKLVGREESRFGFALTNLRDINNDGYEDVAIGAPYEGMGAVYIYLGSKSGLISTPSQVVHSESTPQPLRTFGYSLSGGIDMDLNGYPDLMVGAYEDDAVALLRARRIIDIVTFVRFPRKGGGYQDKNEPIDPNRAGCPEDPNSNHTCFAFEACCKVANNVKEDHIRSLRLASYVEAETYSGNKKFSRVWFASGNNRPHFVSSIATLDARSPMHCQREILYLKENTHDIQSPIKFRLNYTLIQDEPKMPVKGAPLPDINNYPILNQQEAARIFEAAFQKDCGSNDVCESDLRLSAKLNLQPSPTQRNYYELLLGESEELAVDLNVTNVGESAYEAQLYLFHSPSLSYVGTKQNDSAICTIHNSSVIVCAIGNPFKNNKSVSIQVRFDPKYLEDDEGKIGFTAFVNSTSKEISVKKPIRLQATVLRRAEMSIKGSAKVAWSTYGGPIIGESAVKKLVDVGPKVVHVYQVFNDGPWKVNSLDVVISWPYEVANDKPHGKWLLYLEETPMMQDGTECQVPQGYVNPLNLLGSLGMEDIDPLFPAKPSSSIESNQTNHMRRRRDTEKVVTTKIIIDKDGHKKAVVSMNCRAGTAKCFKMTCSIRNLQKKEAATIIIKARLWNSTLAEDYPKVDRVNIGSSAEIIIPSTVVIQQTNLTDDLAEAITIVSPDSLDKQEPERVPIWIIIVAAVAGLLLLIFLTLILWKLGFFNRRRPDHTLSGNLQKHRDENPENEALVKHSTNIH